MSEIRSEGLSAAAQKATDPSVLDAIEQIQATILSIIPTVISPGGQLKVSGGDFTLLMAILYKCKTFVGGAAPSFDDGINQIMNICKPLIHQSLEEGLTVLADINQDCEEIKSH
jgi:hypothetical protein